MKKTIAAVFALFLLMTNLLNVSAAASNQVNGQDIRVVVTSPENISGKPVYEENIEFTVTNNTGHELTDIACYLMILDKGRKQTYPVDEFGQEAFQTREITSLPAGKTMTLSIPVKITYVGDFKFNISAINYANDMVYASNTLSVNMKQNSSMNKSLVMVVSGIVPIVVLGGVVFILKRKK